MNLAFFKELFNSQSVTALCWTLFHSLWQGLLFAIIAGTVIMLTRRSKSAFRYNTLSALFVLFVLTTIATFFYELQKVEPIPGHQASGYHSVKITADYPQRWTAVNTDEKFSPAQMLSDFFSKYAHLIVAAWFLILCAKSVKIIFTLLYTRHLIKYKSHFPASEWRKEIALLCHQLKISRTVTLLESEIIKLPVVFGHLKPIIFIPLGLLSNLTPEQVEAILIHELAHIRRNDYVVNLVQNIVEVLFFFNPAILWISSLIREERESCCDDIAIAQTKNTKGYVEALVSFKQLSLYNHSKSAVAFAGSKSNFLNRVSRIVQNKNYTLSSFEKGSLLSCCIIATFLVLAFAHPVQNHGLKGIPVATGKEKKSLHIDTELIVNHQRQPAALHQKLKEKYGIQKGYGWYYGPVNMPGRGLWIDLTARVPVLRPPQPFPPNPPPRRPQWNDRPFDSGQTFPLMIKRFIDDLVSENVVKDRGSLISFHLTNQFLMVNGQRQPDDIQQKLREKYLADPPVSLCPDRQIIKDPKFGIHYYPETGLMGIGITNNRSDPMQHGGIMDDF